METQLLLNCFPALFDSTGKCIHRAKIIKGLIKITATY